MDTQQLLHKYYRKLVTESALKSGIYALVLGFFAALIVAIVSFATKFNGLWLALGLWLGISVASGLLLYFFAFRPTLRQAAARVDALGLDERVITMLEYQDDSSYMAQAQRSNATESLKHVDAKQLKFTLLKLPVIALLVIALLSASLVTASTITAYQYSQNINGGGGGTTTPPPIVPPELTDDEEIIQRMIERLRKIIDDAKVSEELKEDLHILVDELEADLPNYPTTVEKIARIRETQEEIRRRIREELNKIITIGEALQEFDYTKEIGIAIDSGEVAKVGEAFDAMYQHIKDLVAPYTTTPTPDPKLARAVTRASSVLDVIQELYDTADNIEAALALATKVDPAMRDALQTLADAFREAADKLKFEGEIEFPMLGDAIDQAKDDVMGSMGEEPGPPTSEEESLGGDLDDALNDGMEEMGGAPNPDKPTDPDEPGEGPGEGGEPDDKPIPPKDPSDEYPGGSVIDGVTDFNDIFDKSFEEIMQLLESGTLPKDLADKIAQYIGNLNPNLE